MSRGVNFSRRSQSVAHSSLGTSSFFGRTTGAWAGGGTGGAASPFGGASTLARLRRFREVSRPRPGTSLFSRARRQAQLIFFLGSSLCSSSCSSWRTSGSSSSSSPLAREAGRLRLFRVPGSGFQAHGLARNPDSRLLAVALLLSLPLSASSPPCPPPPLALAQPTSRCCSP